MQSIAKSDVFFFITSIGVVVFTIIFSIAGVYLIKILRNFSKISEMLKESVHSATSELAEMSEHVRESPIFTFIFGKRKKIKNHTSKL